MFAARGDDTSVYPYSQRDGMPSVPANGSVSPSLHPLESEALIKSERQEACSYQPVLKWSSSKGREDLSLLHLLGFDKSKIIDPQLSAWSQHTIEIPEGLL